MGAVIEENLLSAVCDTVRAPLDAREHAVTAAPTVMKGGGCDALAPGLLVGGTF